MGLRIGKVTKVLGTTGKLQVLYEDEGNTSLPLAMLSMNNEYSAPSIGDRVLTLHMDNGSSKGFVLGTFYGGGLQPKTSSGYRKEYNGGAYSSCQEGSYTLYAPSITIEAQDVTLKCSYGEITLEELLKRLERAEDSLGLPHTI